MSDFGRQMDKCTEVGISMVCMGRLKDPNLSELRL